MIIANDPEKKQVIYSAPDTPVTLNYIISDLWPKLGFIDPENPGVILIAEFMLNELILKNSESLQRLNLLHLKELFNGDPDDDEYGEMDMEGLEDLDPEEAEALKQLMAEAQARDMKQMNNQHESKISEKRDEEEEDRTESPEQEAKKAEKRSSDNYSSDGDNRFMDIADLKKQQESGQKGKDEEDYEDDFN